MSDVKFKYDEKEYLEKALQHIGSTYNQHYVGEDNVQYMDLIMNADEGFGFLKMTSPKYILRYGKKKGYNDEDIYKAIHFLVLLLHYKNKKGLKNETVAENN